MDDLWVAVDGPAWAYLAALLGVFACGGLVTALVLWALWVRPVRRTLHELQTRDTLPVEIPVVPSRTRTDTLISRC